MNRTILSINGNKPMNFLLQTVLSEKYGFVAATDVFNGMSYLKTRDDIGLVIVDIDNMDQDNWDFIEHTATSSIYQRPIIVLSSTKNRKIEEKMNELKLTHLIQKPFSPQELVRKVDSIMFAETVRN